MLSLKIKERIVIGGLLALLVWPPVHHAIARALGFSPWKGCGWAMFCVPGRHIGVMVVSLDDGTRLNLETGRTPADERLQRAVKEFGLMRREFGAWAKPDDLAAAVFEAFPNVQRIRIVVQQNGVDRASARFVTERTDPYDYPRADFQ